VNNKSGNGGCASLRRKEGSYDTTRILGSTIQQDINTSAPTKKQGICYGRKMVG